MNISPKMGQRQRASQISALRFVFALPKILKLGRSSSWIEGAWLSASLSIPTASLALTLQQSSACFIIAKETTSHATAGCDGLVENYSHGQTGGVWSGVEGT